MEEIKKYLLRELGLSEEQYQEMVTKKRSESVSLADKNIIAELTQITLENDNSVADMLGVLFMSVDQLSALIVNQAMEIEMLKTQLANQ